MEKESIDKNIIEKKVLKKLFSFTKPYKYAFYGLIFLTILLSVLGPLRPFLIQKLIDDYVAFNDYKGVLNMIIILALLLFSQVIIQFFHTYYSGWIGQNIIKDIRIKLYEHIQSLRLSFFDKTPVGRLGTRNVSDIETLSEVFSAGIAGIISDILQLLVIFGIMLYMNWVLALVSLSLIPILVLATYVFKEKVKGAFNKVRTAVANLNTFVQEHISGMNIVQIFNSEKIEYKKFLKINEEHKNANIRAVLYYSIYFPVADVIQAAGIGLIIWYGGGEVVQGNIQFGTLIAFVMFNNMFFRPIRMLADRFNTLQLGIVSTNRIMKLLSSEEKIANTGTFKVDTIRGGVKFENVWFAYNQEDWVLKDISFEIKEGETLALVGATGAGKSSIINLLTRFYEINKGNIYIDGKNIRAYDLRNLRNHISVVLQDVFLFSDSIQNNITLNDPNVSFEKVKEVAKMVNALDFIKKLPGAFDYNVKERGAVLSVGQRQLISFVRAMIFDPKIIILDEATSSVDNQTEELIQKAILSMMKDRTSIVIAHRLSTIQNADKIIVMDHGKIVEIGTHTTLLEKKGYYSTLHHMQYKNQTS